MDYNEINQQLMAILEQCRNRQLSHNLLDIARRFTGDDVEEDDAQGSDESSEEEDDDESNDDEEDDLSVDSLPEEIQGAHLPRLYIGVHDLHDAIVIIIIIIIIIASLHLVANIISSWLPAESSCSSNLQVVPSVRRHHPQTQ